MQFTVLVCEGERINIKINAKMVAMEQILGSLNSMFNSHSSRKRSEATAIPVKPTNSTRSEGLYVANVMRTGTVHFRSRSALVDILDKSKGSEDTAQALPQEDLLVELALGNESAAYPFVDLWSSDPYTFKKSGYALGFASSQTHAHIGQYLRRVQSQFCEDTSSTQYARSIIAISLSKFRSET